MLLLCRRLPAIWSSLGRGASSAAGAASISVGSSQHPTLAVALNEAIAAGEALHVAAFNCCTLYSLLF